MNSEKPFYPTYLLFPQSYWQSYPQCQIPKHSAAVWQIVNHVLRVDSTSCDPQSLRRIQGLSLLSKILKLAEERLLAHKFFLWDLQCRELLSAAATDIPL